MQLTIYMYSGAKKIPNKKSRRVGIALFSRGLGLRMGSHRDHLHLRATIPAQFYLHILNYRAQAFFLLYYNHSSYLQKPLLVNSWDCKGVFFTDSQFYWRINPHWTTEISICELLRLAEAWEGVPWYNHPPTKKIIKL